GPLLTVERDEAGWLMRCCEGAEAHAFRLPDEFDPFNHYQFRFRKQQDRLIIQYETRVLGEIAAPAAPTRVGLYARRAVAGFEMVRVTAIGWDHRASEPARHLKRPQESVT
ncbi:MAG TPA: hypothetical protein VNO70_19615, partial [Blastocatellia bacterium]|nr:hypothetical protein [Blastocatellia bacterium]